MQGNESIVNAEPLVPDSFSANLLKHVAAIGLCLSSHHRMPALVLIYSGIDFAANLGRPEHQSHVTRSDFVNWAERFMECQRRLGVSGLDLYAARCAVLHTYTMNSSLNDQGKAKPIFYAWGNANIEEPMRLLSSLGRPEVVIKIEDLFATYTEGLAAFCAALGDDRSLAALVEARSRKFFMDHSDFPISPGIEDN